MDPALESGGPADPWPDLRLRGRYRATSGVQPRRAEGTLPVVGGARWANELRDQPDAGAAKASMTLVSSN